MLIFIDTNTYLSYFKMKHGVETLKKIEKFINGNKKVQLLLPTQIKDEFFRNKNKLIVGALESLNDLRLKFNFSYAPKDITEAAQKVSDGIKDLQTKIKNDFINQDSEINKTIKSLFDSAVLVDEDDNIFNQAHKRILKGNPPGKNGSIGDAIVWEILINQYKDETVYIISEDSDWFDEVNNVQLKQFLLDEWNKKCSGKIQIFKHLSGFLQNIAKVHVKKEVVELENRLPTIPMLGMSGYPLLDGIQVYTSDGLAHKLPIYNPLNYGIAGINMDKLYLSDKVDLSKYFYASSLHSEVTLGNITNSIGKIQKDT